MPRSLPLQACIVLLLACGPKPALAQNPTTDQQRLSPYSNPVLNPYLNPYLTTSSIPPDLALLYLLDAQRSSGGIGSGRLSRLRPTQEPSQNPAQPPQAARAPRYSGEGASRYFHRGPMPPGGAARSYFQRGANRFDR